MGDRTAIEWTDASWNPTRGCSIVGPDCQHCYAMRMALRQAGPGGAYEGLAKWTPSGPRWTNRVRFVPEMLDQPYRWKKPRMVFVDSMSDLFHEEISDEQIAEIFGVMADCGRHTFQVLTKRPERAAQWFRWIASRKNPWSKTGALTHPTDECRMHHRMVEQMEDRPPWPLPNVWLILSAGTQPLLEERILHFLDCPAAVRGLSLEPLLGPIELTNLTVLPGDGKYRPRVGLDALRGHLLGPDDLREDLKIDWVITGGESGPGARPSRTAWVRSLRDQCAEAGVPFFFKQWGAHVDRDQLPEETAVALDAAGTLLHTDPDPYQPLRLSKKAAGRELDGETWSQFPAPQSDRSVR